MNDNLNGEWRVIGGTPENNEKNPENDTTEKKKISGIYGFQNKLFPSKWYIGQSIDVHSRVSGYKRIKCEGQIKFYNALKQYGYDGFNNVILEECHPDVGVLNSRESYWVNFYDSVESGYNLRHGGGSHGKMSTETKIKMSLAKIGKPIGPLSASHKLKISMANTGKVRSQEHCLALSKRKFTPEWRNKISVGMKGKNTGKLLGRKRAPFTAEHKSKLSAWQIGKTFSDETRQKMKDAWVIRKLKKLQTQNELQNY